MPITNKFCAVTLIQCCVFVVLLGHTSVIGAKPSDDVHSSSGGGQEVSSPAAAAELAEIISGRPKIIYGTNSIIYVSISIPRRSRLWIVWSAETIIEKHYKKNRRRIRDQLSWSRWIFPESDQRECELNCLRSLESSRWMSLKLFNSWHKRTIAISYDLEESIIVIDSLYLIAGEWALAGNWFGQGRHFCGDRGIKKPLIVVVQM